MICIVLSSVNWCNSHCALKVHIVKYNFKLCQKCFPWIDKAMVKLMWKCKAKGETLRLDVCVITLFSRSEFLNQNHSLRINDESHDSYDFYARNKIIVWIALLFRTHNFMVIIAMKALVNLSSLQKLVYRKIVRKTVNRRTWGILTSAARTNTLGWNIDGYKNLELRMVA